jgi:hypothetical protein
MEQNKENFFSKFTFAKFNFSLTVQEDMLLPVYKASMFRGGFGSVFKKLNCVNRLSKECGSCPLKKTCAYGYIFETSDNGNIPKPYVIEVPFEDKRGYQKGETLNFSLVLLGKAIDYLPYFIFSFIELGKQGITKQNFKFSLNKVSDSFGNEIFKDNKIVSNGKKLTAKDAVESDKTKIVGDKLNLDFITPLRLTDNGNLVVKPDFEAIVKALTRRINAIAKYHCAIDETVNHLPFIDKAKTIETFFSGLNWKDWTRYSNRQKTTMEFGGLIGNIVFKGNFEEFIPYLIIGSHIHIGKNCVFGQGKYNIL